MQPIQHITAALGSALTAYLAFLHPTPIPEWGASIYMICFVAPYILD